MRKFFAVLLVLSLAIGFILNMVPQTNAEEKYPNKQINWYMSPSAGGGTDIMSRIAALRLRRILKVPIVITTLSGGQGARMLNFMLTQPPDGYHIYSFISSNLATIARGLTKATIDDIAGIARGSYDMQSFCVTTDGRFKTIRDAVEYGKSSKQGLKFGIASMGGIDQLTVYEFSRASGCKAEYVPFKSGGQITVALLNGTIDVGVLNPSEFMALYEAKKIKPVIFFNKTRAKDFPDVPTAKELGWNVVFANWRGFITKAGTPEPILKTLEEGFLKSMNHKIYQNYLRDNSMGPEGIMGREEWNAFIKEEYPVWKKGMKELGYIKP